MADAACNRTALVVQWANILSGARSVRVGVPPSARALIAAKRPVTSGYSVFLLIMSELLLEFITTHTYVSCWRLLKREPLKTGTSLTICSYSSPHTVFTVAYFIAI